MSHRKLEFRGERRDDTTWIYKVSGDLYGTRGGYGLQQEIREKIAGGAKGIVLDLADVENIDSSGIGILVSMMWSASRAGGKFVLVAISGRVRDILGIVLLLDHIDHAETVEEALEKIGSGA